MLSNVSYKNVFLIDGIGAIITAIMLGIVLSSFQPYFGMPQEILYGLAAVAVAFAVYSLSCYLWVGSNWKPFLRGIAIANTSYCIITLSLIVVLWSSLTLLGKAYFIGEIALVMTLVKYEWDKTSSVPAK